MSRNVACVSGVHKDVFKWLGGKPLISWTLDRMEDVRGLDEVFVAITSDTRERAKSSVMHADYDAVVADPACVNDDLKLMSWLSKHDKVRKADRFLFIRPFTPFMTAGRMEHCLELLKGGKNKAVMTVQKGELLGTGPKGEHQILRGVAPVTGLRAVRPLLLWPTEAKWPGDFATVDVSFREGLDVSDPERFELAQAIVDSGAL